VVVGPNPRVDAKELRQIRLLLRRPRFIIGQYPVEISGVPFVLAYGGIFVQLVLLAAQRQWCGSAAALLPAFLRRIGRRWPLCHVMHSSLLEGTQAQREMGTKHADVCIL